MLLDTLDLCCLIPTIVVLSLLMWLIARAWRR